MKKVLVISYYWPPSGGAGVQRVLKFVKYFQRFGIKPFVITVREDKASYPVYDTTLAKEIPSEIEVYRTNTFEPYKVYSQFVGKRSIPTGFSNESNPTLFQKFSRFVRGNFFIPDARVGWVNYAYEEAKRLINRKNIKTVLTTSPPHSAQLIGLKLKKHFHIKWIADLRDPWTDIYYYGEFKHMSHAKKKDLKYERSVLENADEIVTVSNSVKELFLNKSSEIDASKIHIIPNGYDDDDFITKSVTPDREFVITYTGTLAESYNPYVFFSAFKKLTEKFPEINFKLRIIGNLAETVTNSIIKNKIDKYLKLIQTVDHDKSIEYLLRSTVLLLVIPEIKNDKGILTGKLFEYLAARKPIICVGPTDGDAAGIITECDAGKTFDRNMENEIILYLTELTERWKVSRDLDIKNDIYEKYSRYNQTKELAEVILDDDD